MNSKLAEDIAEVTTEGTIKTTDLAPHSVPTAEDTNVVAEQDSIEEKDAAAKEVESQNILPNAVQDWFVEADQNIEHCLHFWALKSYCGMWDYLLP
ncbi:Protein of unknown function [Pyronema omphalodes CBS 100304]|uniref:Uncharacterized protein n=1 Tax=Pyronema omphalodes (strain CBS 100304) TaxID=1076935 RepID=U4KUF0_PYROM|nr:Protein of unknown function [Pyronema omphalodes CBS 100304]